MKTKIKIKCPECCKDLILDIDNNEIVSVEIGETIILSQEQIKNLLDDMGLVFGVVKGGENN